MNHDDYVALYEERRALQGQVDKLTSELEHEAEIILEKMLEDGVTSVKLIDGYTVYAHTQAYTRATDRARCNEVLSSLGLEYIIGPNTQSLSAYVREAGGRDHIAEDLYDCTDTYERTSLRVRRSS